MLASCVVCLPEGGRLFLGRQRQGAGRQGGAKGHEDTSVEAAAELLTRNLPLFLDCPSCSGGYCEGSSSDDESSGTGVKFAVCCLSGH